VVGQKIQNVDLREDTMELINGQEVRVKETVNHDSVSITFSLCALVSVDMFYTHFKINQSWGEVLRSVDSVVLTHWASCNPDKIQRVTPGSTN
jgi:hypothetical protein